MSKSKHRAPKSVRHYHHVRVSPVVFVRLGTFGTLVVGFMAFVAALFALAAALWLATAAGIVIGVVALVQFVRQSGAAEDVRRRFRRWQAERREGR